MTSRHFSISIAVIIAACVGCGSSTPEPATADLGSTCHPKAGQKAPAIDAKSIQGKPKVAVEPGKVTIVDFWATWCKPCKLSFPHYQDLYVKYKSAGLDVVAVNVDDEKSDIDGFLKQNGKPTFTVGWDSKQASASCWGPESMPSMFVIDKKGIVREVHKGWHDGDEKDLEKLIKTLL